MFSRTLHAFLLRELKDQFGRFHLSYFWALAEPAALVAILTAIHAFVRGSGTPIYGASPVVFFVFGALPYFLFANCVSRAQGSIQALRGLYVYPQVKPVDVVVAKCIIEAVSLSAVLLLFIVGWWWWEGAFFAIEDVLGLMLSLSALFLLGLSLGFTFEVYGTVNPDLRRLFSILMRPMFFLSGMFFTIDWIPEKYQIWILWNPVLHGVDLTRGAVLAGYDSPAMPWYVVLSILVLAFLGLAAYRRYLHRLM